MTKNQPVAPHRQGPILVQQCVEANMPEPQADEQYFDRLVAFGVASLVAAVIGKLLLTALRRE